MNHKGGGGDLNAMYRYYACTVCTIVRTIHLQNVYSQNVYSQNVYSQNVYSQNVFFTKRILTQRILTKRILTQRILSLNVYSTERILNILYTPGFSLWCSIHYCIGLKRVLIENFLMEAAARAACGSSCG
jgi:hypothetical protein